jgi:hypothetical protein
MPVLERREYVAFIIGDRLPAEVERQIKVEAKSPGPVLREVLETFRRVAELSRNPDGRLPDFPFSIGSGEIDVQSNGQY